MPDAMDPTTAPMPFKVPDAFSGSDAERRRGLRRMRTVAVSLLLLAALVFALTHGADGGLGFVNAAAEAAMVGALADWFAVTAIFKHPLGLPIPHTALIPKRKESLGVSLQEFVTDNFLSEEVVRERVLSSQITLRVARWVSVPEHCRRMVSVGARVTRDVLLRVRDEDVESVVSEVLIPQLAAEPLSAALGQTLQEVVADGAHHGVVDIALDELHRWLVENADAVESIVADRAPWWTPQWLDEKITSRLHQEAVTWVRDIRRDPDHDVRRSLDAYLGQLADDLQHDPDTMQRAEQLKARVLAQPKVVATSISLWQASRRALVEALEEEDGPLRTRAREEIGALAVRVIDDDVLQARVDGMLADLTAWVVNSYGTEIATIISETVNRWDGKEAAARIELHVGRDLQFIRINGTVVGALAGVAIHALSLAI